MCIAFLFRLQTEHDVGKNNKDRHVMCQMPNRRQRLWQEMAANKMRVSEVWFDFTDDPKMADCE